MLNNDQLNGLVPVTITNRKPSGEKFIETENAYVIKVHQGDRQGVHATVKIEGEEFERWIFASDQKGDENYGRY